MRNKFIPILSILALSTVTLINKNEQIVNASSNCLDTINSINYLNVQFDSQEDANLFDAFYSSDGESAITKSFSEGWKIENGKLVSTSNTGYNTLLFKDYGLQSYEMSVDYTPDSSSDGYLALLSKVRVKGLSSRGSAASSYKEYGHGVFVKNSGIATMQGDFRCMGLEDSAGIINKTITGYDSSKTHNIYVKCLNDTYTLKVDGEIIINEHQSAGGIGFMGIQAYKSLGSFDNLKLNLLGLDGEYIDLVPSDDVTRVACVGDSLTYGSQNGVYDANATTPGQLQKMLGSNYAVRNFGLGGRTAIRGSGSCIMDDAEYELARKYKADIIYIMLGTNDSQTTGGYWGTDDEAGATLFMDGYQDLIDGLKETSPNATIYLVISPTYRHKSLEQLTEEMIATRARVYTPIVASNNNLKTIDANEVTKDIDTSHLFDYIHFDAYGYGLIANAIYKQIALDATETLQMPYGENNPINANIGDELVIKQSSYTNPRYSIINSSIGTIDEITGELKINAAGKTTIVAKLGNQSINMPLVVSNGFTMPTISPSKDVVTYGDSMPSLIVNGNLPVAGTLTYKEDYELKMGTNTYEYVFTPSDSKYIVETGSVTITCNKATLDVKAPHISAFVAKDGDKLSSITLPEGFTFENPNQEIVEGRNTAKVIYSVEDKEHYEEVSFDITFRVVYETKAVVEEKGCNGSVVSVSGLLLGVLALLLKRKEK